MKPIKMDIIVQIMKCGLWAQHIDDIGSHESEHRYWAEAMTNIRLNNDLDDEQWEFLMSHAIPLGASMSDGMEELGFVKLN